MIAKSLPDRPWSEWVRRFILHVPHYLSPDGDVTAGGRQRTVRDIARIIKNDLKLEVVVVQKANADWEHTDTDGTRVIGLKCRLDVYGDPQFGWRSSQLLREGDAIIYMGGEDAWPFFVSNAKGYHVGVWWDGPNSAVAKHLTGIRTQALFQACRSIACCDANVINWLRTRDRKYQAAANRAVYIPNAVDLSYLPKIERQAPAWPIRLLFARRFEVKRGPYLILDAAKVLQEKGLDFRLIMSSAVGHDGSAIISEEARNRGIAHRVDTVTNDMDSVMALYGDVDLAIVPTLWSEGTSYSAVEALAAGLPVVTTTVGGLPSLALPNHNGFVVEPQPEALANAILQYRDQALWQRHHTNALSMRESLSMSKWNDRVIDWLLG